MKDNQTNCKKCNQAIKKKFNTLSWMSSFKHKIKKILDIIINYTGVFIYYRW